MHGFERKNPFVSGETESVTPSVSVDHTTKKWQDSVANSEFQSTKKVLKTVVTTQSVMSYKRTVTAYTQSGNISASHLPRTYFPTYRETITGSVISERRAHSPSGFRNFDTQNVPIYFHTQSAKEHIAVISSSPLLVGQEIVPTSTQNVVRPTLIRDLLTHLSTFQTGIKTPIVLANLTRSSLVNTHTKSTALKRGTSQFLRSKSTVLNDSDVVTARYKSETIMFTNGSVSFANLSKSFPSNSDIRKTAEFLSHSKGTQSAPSRSEFFGTSQEMTLVQTTSEHKNSISPFRSASLYSAQLISTSSYFDSYSPTLRSSATASLRVSPAGSVTAIHHSSINGIKKSVFYTPQVHPKIRSSGFSTLKSRDNFLSISRSPVNSEEMATGSLLKGFSRFSDLPNFNVTSSLKLHSVDSRHLSSSVEKAVSSKTRNGWAKTLRRLQLSYSTVPTPRTHSTLGLVSATFAEVKVETHKTLPPETVLQSSKTLLSSMWTSLVERQPSRIDSRTSLTLSSSSAGVIALPSSSLPAFSVYRLSGRTLLPSLLSLFSKFSSSSSSLSSSASSSSSSSSLSSSSSSSSSLSSSSSSLSSSSSSLSSSSSSSSSLSSSSSSSSSSSLLSVLRPSSTASSSSSLLSVLRPSSTASSSLLSHSLTSSGSSLSSWLPPSLSSSLSSLPSALSSSSLLSSSSSSLKISSSHFKIQHNQSSAQFTIVPEQISSASNIGYQTFTPRIVSLSHEITQSSSRRRPSSLQLNLTAVKANAQSAISGSFMKDESASSKSAIHRSSFTGSKIAMPSHSKGFQDSFLPSLNYHSILPSSTSNDFEIEFFTVSRSVVSTAPTAVATEISSSETRDHSALSSKRTSTVKATRISDVSWMSSSLSAQYFPVSSFQNSLTSLLNAASSSNWFDSGSQTNRKWTVQASNTIQKPSFPSSVTQFYFQSSLAFPLKDSSRSSRLSNHAQTTSLSSHTKNVISSLSMNYTAANIIQQENLMTSSKKEFKPKITMVSEVRSFKETA